jgi:hypothetical protein
MTRCLVVLALLVGRQAGANSASCRSDGWGVASGSTLPVHPRITFYADSDYKLPKRARVVAKLDGKDVATKVTYQAAAPFDIATIEIDSDRTGTLELAWQTRSMTLQHPTATFTIAPKLAMPSEVHGTASRFHRAYHHSTVRESWDGLAVAVDANVIEFEVRWRRDASSAWTTLDVPGSTLEDSNVLHLGEISCTVNFDVPTLERGIDLELSAELADGRTLAVTGLPSHVKLDPLPAGTPVSSP